MSEEVNEVEKWNELMINAALISRSIDTEKNIRDYVC